MKFQAGYDHKTIREKKPPCYDKTGVYIESQTLLPHALLKSVLLHLFYPWVIFVCDVANEKKNYPRQNNAFKQSNLCIIQYNSLKRHLNVTHALFISHSDPL